MPPRSSFVNQVVRNQLNPFNHSQWNKFGVASACIGRYRIIIVRHDYIQEIAGQMTPQRVDMIGHRIAVGLAGLGSQITDVNDLRPAMQESLRQIGHE